MSTTTTTPAVAEKEDATKMDVEEEAVAVAEAVAVPVLPTNDPDDASSSSAAAAAKPLPDSVGKKRPRSPEPVTKLKRDAVALASILEVKRPEAADKISVSSIAAASQLSSAMGWNGLGSLLSLSLLTNSSSNNNGNTTQGGTTRLGRTSPTIHKTTLQPSATAANANAGSLPTKEQVLQAAIKAVNDAPPFVHLSKTDSAPQLKITNSHGNEENGVLVNDRLACKQAEGEIRGYRMTRATHGVPPGAGHYYYEAVVLEPPTAKDLVDALPPNVRMGKKLQQEMEKGLSNEKSSTFGSHVRLGWSMRTGDLQAPVGYDKWSYGLRDIQGSKIHCSRREDHWGGEEFGPGDVIGCAISMVEDADEAASDAAAATSEPQPQAQQPQDPPPPRQHENHIRFFKNGLPMGEFVITKGKREGGVAFFIPNGVYYPAVSLYMGATVKLNFGPHFVCPPRKLPSTLSSSSSSKKSSNKQVFRPLSSICKPPLTVEEATAKVQKEQKTLFFRNVGSQPKKFLELVETEATVLQEAYRNHRKKHLADVIEERTKRNLKCDELYEDEFYADVAIAAEETPAADTSSEPTETKI